MGTPDLATRIARLVPKEWFEQLEVRIDKDEVLVVGTLAEGASPAGFREATRAERMAIAAKLEATLGRKVSWGVRQGEAELHFTALSVPVMTRLRLDERGVLDALIDGGIARSRSEALAWCVRLVGQHQGEWLAELTAAAEHVREVRERGPRL